MSLPKLYVKDRGRQSAPIYVAGDPSSFYINFDTPVTDPDFDNFVLNLVRGTDDTLAAANIGVLVKDIVLVSLYNIYSEFIFPAGLTRDYYYFQIKDNVSGVEKCRSSLIWVETDADVIDNMTTVVKYRNSDPLYNFGYNRLPNFFNIMRLLMGQIQLQFESDRKQYRNATDRQLRNTKSYRDPVIQVESYYFTDAMHDAITAVYEHDLFYLNDEEFVVKDAYQIQTKPESDVTIGTINLYKQSASDFVLPTPFVELRFVDVRYGWLDSNAALLEADILALSLGSMQSGGPVMVDMRANAVFKYPFICEPATEQQKLIWQAGSGNFGSIGGTNNLYGDPYIVGTWRVYPPNYKTRQQDYPITLKFS